MLVTLWHSAYVLIQRNTVSVIFFLFGAVIQLDKCQIKGAQVYLTVSNMESERMTYVHFNLRIHLFFLSFKILLIEFHRVEPHRWQQSMPLLSDDGQSVSSLSYIMFTWTVPIIISKYLNMAFVRESFNKQWQKNANKFNPFSRTGLYSVQSGFICIHSIFLQ